MTAIRHNQVPNTVLKKEPKDTLPEILSLIKTIRREPFIARRRDSISKSSFIVIYELQLSTLLNHQIKRGPQTSVQLSSTLNPYPTNVENRMSS